MAQAPAPQVDPDPATDTKTPKRASSSKRKAKDTCLHAIFYYEDEKRLRMVCCACGW